MFSSQKKNLTFLIIGGGSIGRRHIKNLHELGYHNVYCLKRQADAQFELQEKVKVVTSIHELIEKVDAVIVCSPTSLHNEGIAIATQLNAAVFMEKPLIHNQEGVDEAISLMSSNTNPFFIGFMLRYHPLVKKINSVLDSDILGEIYSARFSFGSYLPYWHPWENHQLSYASIKALGGGVINTITHELDLIQYLFGTPKSVLAEKMNLNILDIEVEELAEAIFKYDEKLVTLHLDFLQKDYDRNILILGKNGKLTWNWHENKITIKKHKETPIIYLCDEFDVNQLYINELIDFIKLIYNKNLDHQLNFNHALLNSKVMLATHEAAEKGERILI